MILMTIVLVLFLTHFGLSMHKTVKTIESDDFYGDLSSNTNSVYWNVLSEPGTNRIQFVLMLPVTTAIGSGSKNLPSYDHDYCDLQIESNHHQWKIEDDLNWTNGVKTVQLRDLTANTASSLDLNSGRFWQLDDEGHPTPIENIDSNVMAKIFSQLKEKR